MNRKIGDSRAVLNLPEEIEMDILSRLRVESLLRFRCVSEPSRSLISDPHFVKLHLNRSILSENSQKMFWSSFPPRSIDYESLLDYNNNNNNDDDINGDDNKALVKLDCPLWSRNRHVSVIGSCNGLICYVVDGLNVVLYNPSTRVSKELPKPPSSSTPSLSCRTGSIGYYYGFAFDSSDDDYKVVLVTDIIDDASKSIRFHIFSLRHNSWRRIEELGWSHLGRYSMCNKGIFLNGALHWLLIPRGIESLERVIVSFDLSKEVFSETSLDNIIQGGQTDFSFHTFGAFEECLYALGFRNRFSANERSVEVWLTKEHGVKASWTKFITIPCIVGILFTPLCFLRNGELLLKIDQTKLGSYNTKDNTFTTICNCNCPYFSEAVLYVESLVSPNGIDGNVKQPKALGPIAVTFCGRLHSYEKKAVMMMLMWLIFISLWMNVES